MNPRVSIEFTGFYNECEDSQGYFTQGGLGFFPLADRLVVLLGV